jgi:hypothetical protein
MGDVYFGCNTHNPDSNWNTVANWFSTTGINTSKTFIPGTPLGRLPNASTDNVIIFVNAGGGLQTGPTGGYNGPITINTNNLGVFSINAGVFGGTISVVTPVIFFGSGVTITGTIISIGPIISFGELISVQSGYSGHPLKPTYSPTATITVTQTGISGYPNDFGFASNGIFTPNITVSGFPDILGTGLL